ncbi:Glycosyltransferase involved in cell wall bisynthesis [Saccharicrinis carchari]|uniref:Glycosyltransferase involved in cell wall bisynthesis n=1 Tax=Saccharicrinis carchari TaxID=1168039 RepID=A0A521EPA6_SACCC|nr:glycosyltransferase family 4 protein [Saccharicrinis carchari]SMO85743.1 Glycosyltransferase involved in cell wall bisynthesis [Saccharicrinis carchari]
MTPHQKSICFVIPHFVTFSTGGAEIQVHYLTQAFLQRGWKVEVLCAGKGKEEQIKASPYFNKNIRYHYYRKRSIRSLEFFEVLRVLKNTNSSYYYQRTDFALTASTYFYAKKNKRKMVYALAMDTDSHRNKYSTDLNYLTYKSKIKKWIRKTDYFILDRMLEWCKKRVSYVVCQNQYQQQTYKNNFGIEGLLIPNSFIPGHSTRKDKKNVVLWVGNKNPAKQANLFVELAQKFNGLKNWHFVMMGSACEEVDRASVPGNLSVLGPVPYAEANNWFAKAKIYVNTSLYEGMPNTFIQSWYFNTLVLSLNVDTDFVFSGIKAGYCFNGDMNKMTDKLRSFINGKTMDDTLQKGMDYFKEKFDINRNMDALIKYIQI